MSATRDKTQKITFVYQNLYSLYQTGKAAAHAAPEVAPVSVSADSGLTRVLKSAPAEDLAKPYVPIQLMGKRVAKPAAVQVAQTARVSAPVAQAAPEVTVQTLRQNLAELQSLQKRMAFFLEELEELTQDE